MRGSLVITIWLLAICGRAQSLERSVLGSYGAFYFQPSAGSLSITAGEAATATLAGATHTLTQGFQQPTDFSTQALVHDPLSDLHFFPNPAHTDLLCTGNDVQDLTFSFSDPTGRAVEPPALRFGDRVVFDVSGLAPGAYSITVFSRDHRLVAVERIIRH